MTSDYSEMVKEIDHIGNMFRERGYPNELISDVTGYVKREWGKKYKPLLGVDMETNKETTNSNQNNKKYNRACILGFNPYVNKVKSIIHKNWNILRCDEGVHNKLGTEPLFVYKTGKNLKRKIQNSDRNNDTNSVGTSKCGRCNQCCAIYEEHTRTIDNINKTTVRFKKGNCQTQFVIYLAICTKCPCFYVGKTERRLRN